MNERQLQCIQAIAREGSIHKASAVLSKSPSTLARMLKQSEETLRVTIFFRTPDGMKLTEQGKEILCHVEELLTMLDKMRTWIYTWKIPQKDHQWSEIEIYYLLTVSEEKSISRAAKKLYLTQPSLSQMVQDIETDLETTIFHRTREGVTETPFGQELLKRLREIYFKYSELIGKII